MVVKEVVNDGSGYTGRDSGDGGKHSACHRGSLIVIFLRRFSSLLRVLDWIGFCLRRDRRRERANAGHGRRMMPGEYGITVSECQTFFELPGGPRSLSDERKPPSTCRPRGSSPAFRRYRRETDRVGSIETDE